MADAKRASGGGLLAAFLIEDGLPIAALCSSSERLEGGSTRGRLIALSLVMALPAHARAWLRQRDLGAVALAAIEADELRQLDVAAALAQSEALLAATPLDAVSEERRSTSGFVEQQRLFARARR